MIPVAIIIVAIVAIAGYIALAPGPTTTGNTKSLTSTTTLACSFDQCSTSSAATTIFACTNSPCVQGNVNVGPLCPAEYATTTVTSGTATTTYGCGTNTAISVNYAQYYLLFSPANAGTTESAYLNSTGYFALNLPAGMYKVTMPNCPWAGCSDTFPKNVTVLSNQVTNLNITIDTGIR